MKLSSGRHGSRGRTDGGREILHFVQDDTEGGKERKHLFDWKM
jgi:hypothetical protein